jgi:hypothetical protein
MSLTQNSGAQTAPQPTKDDSQADRNSQTYVPDYVPPQGQGPDYVHKGAGSGKF